MTSERVWFITGVSAGLGRALAEVVLEAGERVVGTVRQAEQVSAFEALKPGASAALVMDVREAEQVNAAVRGAIERFGRIDVLVNNSGHGMLGAIEEVSDAEARALFDVNVFGVLNVLRAALPAMRAQRSGFVINMSSQGGVRSFPGSGHYCASKHALEAISDSLAIELADSGVNVLIVEPGPFRTEFAGRSMVVSEQVIEDYASTSGMRRATLKNVDGKQKGDPVRAARAILQAVNAPQPPRRLALGADALSVMREKVGQMQKDWETWEEVSLKADYPPEELD
ncbi:MAG: SDR family NAD(P)-dependent oxidoreductase [Anaerolineae bacterium]|nr:SDR family NAD(P)-dependent oxidoreductase [Anaerolineae bacterium]